MTAWNANNFLPPLASASVLGATAQPPTTFFVFPGRGRIWSAHLSFAVASNSLFNPTGSTQQFYARILTSSGIVFGGPVELALGAANHEIQGDADLKIDGLLVAANDTLQLDVNNGITVSGTNGVMHASCAVLYSVP